MFKDKNTELSQHVLDIRRISYVTKGGRKQRIAALVVVGDKNGSVGVGLAKAKEVKKAVDKATNSASNRMFNVHLFRKRTVNHDVVAKYDTTKVIVRSRREGTGIVASNRIKSILKVLGCKDLNVKVVGSTNSHNIVKALLKALLHINSARELSIRRGIPIAKVLSA